MSEEKDLKKTIEKGLLEIKKSIENIELTIIGLYIITLILIVFTFFVFLNT